MDWVKKNGTETFTKRNRALIAELKKQGFKTFYAAGTCWGGWAAFRCSMDFPKLLKKIVIWHPSCQLEGALGGDVEKLAAQVDCPVFFHVTSNDDDTLYNNETGKLVRIIRENNLECKVDTYPDMIHGFMTRGSDDDPNVQRDIKRAIASGISFFEDHNDHHRSSFARKIMLCAAGVTIVGAVLYTLRRRRK